MLVGLALTDTYVGVYVSVSSDRLSRLRGLLTCRRLGSLQTILPLPYVILSEDIHSSNAL